MKQVIKDDVYDEIIFQESFITGKRSITVNGNALERVSKKEFKMPNGNLATITGGFIQGACLVIDGKTIRLTPKLKWYEIALAVIPFIFVMIWGNIEALCRIIPVVGGAIGGGISAFISVLGFYGIKCVKPIWLKIVVAIVALGVTFGICCGIGYAILDTLS